MRLFIIGTGTVGCVLIDTASKVGHDVIVIARDVESPRNVPTKL